MFPPRPRKTIKKKKKLIRAALAPEWRATAPLRSSPPAPQRPAAPGRHRQTARRSCKPVPLGTVFATPLSERKNDFFYPSLKLRVTRKSLVTQYPRRVKPLMTHTFPNWEGPTTPKQHPADAMAEGEEEEDDSSGARLKFESKPNPKFERMSEKYRRPDQPKEEALAMLTSEKSNCLESKVPRGLGHICGIARMACKNDHGGMISCASCPCRCAGVYPRKDDKK